MRLLRLARVEARAADWRSLAVGGLLAIAFALFAAQREPGFSTQQLPIRFALAALGIGLLMAMTEEETEVMSSLPVGLRARMMARFLSVGGVWAGAVLFVLVVGNPPPEWFELFLEEAVAMGLVALFLAGVASRTSIVQISQIGAFLYAAVFLLSWMIPDGLNPWLSVGPEGSPGAPEFPWHILAALIALLFILATRSSRPFERWSYWGR